MSVGSKIVTISGYLFLDSEFFQRSGLLPHCFGRIEEFIRREENDHAIGDDIREIQQYLSKLRDLTKQSAMMGEDLV